MWYPVEDSNPYLKIRSLGSYTLNEPGVFKMVGDEVIETSSYDPKS